MRKLPLALLLVTLVGGGALAQPGPDPAPYPQPYPQPQPQPAPQPPQQPGYGPQGYAPPAHNYVPVQLTADEAAILQQGEITDGAHIGGALVSLFFGFGIGQAVQGRYSETGWIFTLGEAASMAALIYGFTKAFDDCFDTIDGNCNDGNNDNAGVFIAGGLIGILVFRVWEVVDAFGGPQKHNQRVRNIRMKLGMPVPMYTQKVTPFMNRARDGGGTVGLTFKF